jgi:hypothetical protein
MFDEFRHFQRFEHERSRDKNFCILHDKSSLAGSCAALDNLIHEYFVRCGLRQLLPKKSLKAIKSAEQRIKTHLRSLFWHFYLAMGVDDDCYVRISLRAGSYCKTDPDNPHNITIEICEVIKALELNDFIERRNGFNDKTGGGGSTETRIRPCLSLLEDLRALPKDISEDFVEPSPVSIRKGAPTDLDEESALHLDRMKRTITAYNEFMRSHKVVMPKAANGKLLFSDWRGRKRSTATIKKSVMACYHADQPCTLTYGRIHGAWWQNIPSTDRKHILIDGEETVELDYSAQLVHIIAGLEGIQLSGDPYEIALSGFDWRAARMLIKSIILVIVNASDDEKSAFKAIRSKVYEAAKKKKIQLPDIRLTDAFLKAVLNRVLAKHPFLDRYAFSGMGKTLFMIDAEIARQIIQTFLDHGKAVLSIHDGFIVKQCDEQFLFTTMQSVCFEMFGTTIPIKPAD